MQSGPNLGGGDKWGQWERLRPSLALAREAGPGKRQNPRGLVQSAHFTDGFMSPWKRKVCPRSHRTGSSQDTNSVFPIP